MSKLGKNYHPKSKKQSLFVKLTRLLKLLIQLLITLYLVLGCLKQTSTHFKVIPGIQQEVGALFRRKGDSFPLRIILPENRSRK